MKKFFLIILLLFGLCGCTKSYKMKKEILEKKEFCGTSSYEITHLTFYDDDTYDYYYNNSSVENSEYEVKGKKFSHVKTFTNKYKDYIFSSSSGLYRNEKQTLSVYSLDDFGGTEEKGNKYVYFIYRGGYANLYFTNDSSDSLKNKSYYDQFKDKYGRIDFSNQIQPRSYKNSVW